MRAAAIGPAALPTHDFIAPTHEGITSGGPLQLARAEQLLVSLLRSARDRIASEEGARGKNLQIKDNIIQIDENFLQFERIELALASRFLEMVASSP